MPNPTSEAVREETSRQPRSSGRRENMHAWLSPDLLVRMAQAAAVERMSLNEFVPTLSNAG